MHISYLRAILASAVFVCSTFVLSSSIDQVWSYPSFKESIREQINWVSQHTDYSASVPFPEIIFATHEELQFQYFGLLGNKASMTTVLALYDSDTKTIYIQRLYLLDNAFRRTFPIKPFYLRPKWYRVMLHELTHYLQDVGDSSNSSTDTRLCHYLDEQEAQSMELIWRFTHELDMKYKVAIYTNPNNLC